LNWNYLENFLEEFDESRISVFISKFITMKSLSLNPRLCVRHRQRQFLCKINVSLQSVARVHQGNTTVITITRTITVYIYKNLEIRPNLPGLLLQVKGKKSHDNQDRLVCSQQGIMGLNALQGISANHLTWGSVFDGHGGSHVSSTAASKMHSVVESNAHWRSLSRKAVDWSTLYLV